MPALNAPTQTNPPFTSPPTWPFPTTALWWEADYRLRLLESAIIYAWQNGLPPSGPGTGAGGDLSGVYPNPTVVKINGMPVSATIPSLNQTLVWNGTTWVPGSPATALPPNGPAAGDLSGTYPNPSVAKLQGQAVSGAVPTNNQVLEWNGSAWTPTSLPAALPPNGAATGDLSLSYPNPRVSHMHVPACRAAMTGTVNLVPAFGAYGFSVPNYMNYGFALGLGNWPVVPLTGVYQVTIFLRFNAPVTDFVDVTLGYQSGGVFTRLASPEGAAGVGAWCVILSDIVQLTAGIGYGPYVATGGSTVSLQTTQCGIAMAYISDN